VVHAADDGQRRADRPHGLLSGTAAICEWQLGGVIIDRLGYRRVSVSADLVSGIGVAAIPLLYATSGLAFWQLLGSVFVGGLLAIPGLTARRSMLPELASLAGIRLERMNATFEGITYMALPIGPALAGVLVTLLGPANVLWLDAASFALSALVAMSLLALPVLRELDQPAPLARESERLAPPRGQLTPPAP
jgi:MFS family permease